MKTPIVAYIQGDLATTVIVYIAIVIALFLISLYIFRSIFNIPTFLRYQKAQIRLLEEIARHQGVDGAKVQSIISESSGWDNMPTNPAENTEAVGS